jgi:ABC-type cobalamin/Fe3+-siderophores transport system ATPase subunit
VRDIATINRELEECKKKSRDLDTEIATHNQQQKTWDSWNEKKQTRELSLKELQGQLKDISDWAAANPEVAVDADLSQYTLENVGSEQVAIVAKVGRLGGEISQLLETATAETAKLRDLQLQRNAIPAVDANQWSMMQSLVAQKQELQEALTEKETVHNSLLQEQASVQSLGEELISSYRRERQYADALSIAESVMPLVRPTGVPQAVLRGMLKHTADRMTALCQELGQPFIVDVDDNLEFAVRKPNGRVEIARRLSGGQQACLAVVLWLTRLMQGLGPGLPILVLDEPSANMGPDVIPQFAQLLMTLNKILIEKKKQVVITTHHSQLQYCGAGQIRFEL